MHFYFSYWSFIKNILTIFNANTSNTFHNEIFNTQKKSNTHTNDEMKLHRIEKKNLHFKQKRSQISMKAHILECEKCYWAMITGKRVRIYGIKDIHSKCEWDEWICILNAFHIHAFASYSNLYNIILKWEQEQEKKEEEKSWKWNRIQSHYESFLQENLFWGCRDLIVIQAECLNRVYLTVRKCEN